MPTLDTPKRGLPERFYARFGWKVFLLVAAAVWTFGLILSEAATLNVVRMHPIPRSNTIFLAVLVAVVIAAAGVIAQFIALRLVAPLRRTPRSQQDLAAAWEAAVSFPLTFAVRSMTMGLVLISPAVIVGFGHAFGFRIPLLIYAAIGIAQITAVTVIVLIFVAAVLVRPFLTDLQKKLEVLPSSQTVTLRTRLILLIPIGVGATATGAAFAQPTRIGITTSTIVAIALTSAFALFMWTPVTALFAHSMLTPIADLQAATERIKHGDYSQPIAEMWADELGAVAVSLNEAMRGLSERQQMARDVRESRARIVAAADASRKRIERNIHDGAQQRLVALTLDARLLETQIPTMSDDETIAAVQQLAEGLKEALAELRDLARGLHPAILTTDGLGPALTQLAARSAVPISVDAPSERLPDQVETTAYFVAAEALANVAKYARATHAAVTATHENGRLSIEIVDDGVGGACASSGSGLSGLADRVAAIGGRLTVESESGKGTRIAADLPVDGSPNG